MCDLLSSGITTVHCMNWKSLSDVFLRRLSITLSHMEVIVQRILAPLFRSVPVAIVSECHDDVVHGEVCEVPLPRQRLASILSCGARRRFVSTISH